MLPDVSIPNPLGLNKLALLAAPSSPPSVVEPVPANVVIIPVETVILRIR
jgi:hypothetical protein